MSSNPNKPRQLFPQTTHLTDSYTSKPRTQITFSTQGRTKQSFKDECDVNRLMARYQATGEIPNLNDVDPQYLDATGYDYQEHQNFIAGANSLFHEMPSAIRARFSNSPAEFLDFCSQPKNRPEMAEMGLLRPQTPELISTPTSNLSTAQNASKEVPPLPEVKPA